MVKKSKYNLHFKNKSDKSFYQYTVDLMQSRGVNLKDIADLVFFLQRDYQDSETLNDRTIYESINAVLQKREVQNAIITGIELDKLAEEHKLSEPLQSILEKDEPLYGIDEIMTFSIVNLYGSIGFTNYGYIDKVKPGILRWLNDRSTGYINVFLDDLVGAIAAAAASRLAHTEAKLEDSNSTYNTNPLFSQNSRIQFEQRRTNKGKEIATNSSLIWGETLITFDSNNVTKEEILKFLKKRNFPQNTTSFSIFKMNNQLFLC